MSDSVQPHRQQPTRLPHPWDSPGKNTGVGCHFLLQCMQVKSVSEVAQSCPTASDPMDCSLAGSSVHGICQATVLDIWLLLFLPAILIPACASSSPAFLMMYSAYKLNKQGNSIQPRCTPFPIWNQSIVPCPVASWPDYRFLRRMIMRGCGEQKNLPHCCGNVNWYNHKGEQYEGPLKT